MIVIHYTEMNFEDAIARLCDPLAKVSTHYLIKSDGQIFKLVDTDHVAWHAGESSWKDLEKINDHSIGIELDNSGYSNFPISQMNSCVDLCQQLSNIHQISRFNIIGHSDIAPSRKIDPGIFFDWLYLAKHKLGIWHNIDTLAPRSKVMFHYGDQQPEILITQNNLKKLGYKIELTGIFDDQTNFVIRAFQSHFYQPLIRKLGVNFYRNHNSKYFWDNISEEILKELISI
jgi:N-acetylmuramoyl-L-alanine amidase